MVADASTGYGRSIFRGAMRYANLQRQWLIRTSFSLSALSKVVQRQFDGAIIAGPTTRETKLIRRLFKHAVVCSGTVSADVVPVASLDDYAVGVMAAEHLLECRLQHFAFYGNAGLGTSLNRYRGFKDTVTQAGFSCVDVGMGWLTPAVAMEGTLLAKLIAWLNQLKHPIGMMCVDDSAALEVATACQEANISVPDRVAIIGVNNDDLLCESAWPPLSSVDGDYARVGYAAAELLDRLMAGERLRKAERVVRLAPLGIVRRQSTDLLAITDENIAAAVRFIREHACDPCGVSDVLRHVPVSRRWLEKQFETILGRGPYDEILRVRIEPAKRLLAKTQLKIDDLPGRCGFSAVQPFRRAFLRATGTTPGAYRRARASVN
ncbi:MAG: substrate-binding domain-containing protein [Tepidisphaeraceae bacterium]